jgi:3-oxoacyl-[acyl-carrier-protein] synthase-3
MGAAHCDTRVLGVLGTGAALPGSAVTTAELLSHMDQTFKLGISTRGKAAARRLGVKSRHIARDLRARQESPRTGDSNAELAARAVRVALSNSGCQVADVAYLIAHTATPGSLLPPGAAQVSELLGYDGPFVELRQACTGFANALVFATSLIGNQRLGVAVLVGSETGSAYFDPQRAAEDDSQLINMLQMGDGAGAIVLDVNTASSARILGHYTGQLGGGRPPAFRLSAGGSNDPAAAGVCAEFVHDFRAIRRDGTLLFQAAVAAASSMGFDLDSVDRIIPHQANGRMDVLLADALGVSRERVFVNADRIGNTGSAAIWLALNELRPQLAIGERVLVLGAEATKFMYGGFLYVHG